MPVVNILNHPKERENHHGTIAGNKTTDAAFPFIRCIHADVRKKMTDWKAAKVG